MNGRAQLRRLVSAAEAGRRIPHDVLAWLTDGIDAFEQGAPLAAALGLRTTAELRARRDHHLRHAARLMPARWSVSQRARRMQAAAPGLEAHLLTGADHLDGWRAHLFEALAAAPLPADRQLREIVGDGLRDRQTPPGNCNQQTTEATQ